MKNVSVAGVDIPVLGVGTWKLTGEACAPLVAAALKGGYRHVDTAAVYGNEVEVGEGLRASGVPREAVFLTTKVWRDDLAESELERAAEASLRRLGVDQVDLLLVHWPNEAFPLAGTMKALARAKRRGLARAIGVSNYPVALLEEATALCPEPLAVNQVEYHPYLSQRRVLEAVRRHGMALTAYSPLAEGNALRDPAIAEIARAHDATPAQVAIAWLIRQPGVIAIPKTASPERAAQNLKAAELRLSDDEAARIAALARPDGRQISFGGWVRWDPAD
jgi:diketogulonate reductase-like aldo/keto reductase